MAKNFGFANVAMFHHRGQRPDGDIWGVGGCLPPPHYSASYVGLQASVRMFMCTIVPVGFNLTCHGSQSLVYNVCSFGGECPLPLDLVSYAFITA